MMNEEPAEILTEKERLKLSLLEPFREMHGKLESVSRKLLLDQPYLEVTKDLVAAVSSMTLAINQGNEGLDAVSHRLMLLEHSYLEVMDHLITTVSSLALAMSQSGEQGSEKGGTSG